MVSVDCTGCVGLCCRNHVISLCPTDLLEFRKLGLNPVEYLFLEPVDQLTSRFSDVLIDGKYVYLTLKRRKNGYCVFARKENKNIECSIYDNRPLNCRLYPLKLTSKKRIVKRGSIVCPLTIDKNQSKEKVTKLNDKIQREIKNYEEKAYKWNKKGGGNLKELLDYL
ncbi:MAG: YkgJ family cysteine cluster protein [Methanobacteriota archaeon]